tara:strand:- start:464 stop:1006 length:543 start_codon:yes stop_codon:yes gene_type:complete
MREFYIGIAEYYWDKRHNYSHNILNTDNELYNNNLFLNGHIILMSIINSNYITNKRKFKVLEELLLSHRLYYYHYIIIDSIWLRNNFHPIIKNYEQILSSQKYFVPHIVEKVFINGYRTCILKTCYIKIIQRAWKNVFKKRKEILIKRKNIKNLMYKEINGKWPENCFYLPSLKNMLKFI